MAPVDIGSRGSSPSPALAVAAAAAHDAALDGLDERASPGAAAVGVAGGLDGVGGRGGGDGGLVGELVHQLGHAPARLLHNGPLLRLSTQPLLAPLCLALQHLGHREPYPFRSLVN